MRGKKDTHEDVASLLSCHGVSGVNLLLSGLNPAYVSKVFSQPLVLEAHGLTRDSSYPLLQSFQLGGLFRMTLTRNDLTPVSCVTLGSLLTLSEYMS